MITYKSLTAVCAATLLGLSACGGGGSGGGGGGGGDDKKPTTDLTALFAAAQGASSAATAAGKAATDAQTAAGESAKMLTTTATGGESKTAMTNAQAVLNARDAAAKAVTDAKAALDAANQAKTGAEDVADDHPQKSALDAAIAAAITAATNQVTATEKVRDGQDLLDAVTDVTGSNGKGTPRSIANSVGEDIAGALAVGNSRAGTRIEHGTTAPASSVAKALKYETDDHQGMTWAMIVGEDNVMTKRLGTIANDGTFAAGNAALSVASIKGMDASAVDPNSSALSATGGDGAGKYTDTYNNDDDDINYKGIPGVVFCLGGSDGCSVKDGKLDGNWYFSPDSPGDYYQKMADNPATATVDESLTYEAETLYASYGHWLTFDTSDPVLWTVNTFATSDGGALVNVAAGTDTNNLKDTASYSGKAAGMSVLTAGSGDSKTTDSGRFTADVSLSAKFGASPTVSGTINNFDGNAVDSGWSVNLGSLVLGIDANVTAVPTTATGRDGTWSGVAYGDDNTKRPAGIYGGFTAHFSNGDAAGAFATRKD